MEKIKYSIIEKNKKVVKIPKLYGRIRAGKKERLVPLGRNMEEAQKWLKRAQRAYEEACDLEAEGSPQVGLEYYQHTRSVEEVREKVFGE